MTKFEEEFKALTSWGWVNVDLLQQILTKFGNWHSDEEFQEMKESYWNQAESILSMLEEIKSLKSQLQQQALPVVPECVGEWYEEHKDDLESSIYRLCIEFNQKVVNTLKTKTKLENWFDYTENKPIETLIRMQEGYTIEKPQLFYLKNKLTNSYLCQYPSDKSFYHIVVDDDGVSKLVTKFTQQEIGSMQTGSYEQIEVTE